MFAWFAEWFRRRRVKRWLAKVDKAVAGVDTPTVDASRYEDWYV